MMFSCERLATILGGASGNLLADASLLRTIPRRMNSVMECGGGAGVVRHRDSVMRYQPFGPAT
ncbi:MAG TPA: hypothetical protein VGN90_12030 [Pyrinomonadaceae bacterium]|nr:hypothetical protein [Pyrinomonadaceae bacterium]